MQRVEEKFFEIFKHRPYIFRSPGRVNLIGEHTDYNMGFVLPAAIDKAIYLAITPRNDKVSKVFAADMNEFAEFSVEDPKKSKTHWANYLIGVVDQLNQKGINAFSGFNCVFGGNIPIGAGLSSSAALETGLIYALNYIYNLGIDKLTMVKLAQRAENEFVGVKCGIMDQYINIFGRSGEVLRIDCRSLDKSYFPFDYTNISIVLFNTNISHSLASTEYNQRRRECSKGVKRIREDHPEVESLRDVTPDLLNEYRSKLDQVIYKRCKYVVEENERVLRACESLNANNLKTFGAYMYQTHEGLSKDYEVSCKELDYLVDLLRDNPEVYGSRMMGGGFGGCTINLIENDSIDFITKKVNDDYKSKFGRGPGIYITRIDAGTSLVQEPMI